MEWHYGTDENCVQRVGQAIERLACLDYVRYTAEAMAKKMTIEGLAGITANGFKSVDRRFDEVDKRFDRIENILLRDHLNRIERLEDTVLRLKVKTGIR